MSNLSLTNIIANSLGEIIPKVDVAGKVTSTEPGVIKVEMPSYNSSYTVTITQDNNKQKTKKEEE